MDAEVDAEVLGANREDGGIPWLRFAQAAKRVFDEGHENHMQRIRAPDM